MKTLIKTVIHTTINFIKAHTAVSISVASIVVATSVAVPVALNLEKPTNYAMELSSNSINTSSSNKLSSNNTTTSSKLSPSSQPESSDASSSKSVGSSKISKASSSSSGKESSSSKKSITATKNSSSSQKEPSVSSSKPVVPPKTGDIVYEGDYQYIYNYTPEYQGKVDKNDPYALWYENPSQNGWGVHLMNGPVREYGPGTYNDGVGKKYYGTIKAEINGKPVVCANYLFQCCNLITSSPALPDTITSLYETYNGCTALTTAPTLPKGVTNINRTFTSCTSLTTAPKTPSTVLQMDSTFAYCSSLITAPEIPANVNALGMCFYGCSSLTGTIMINSSNIENPDWSSCFEGTEKSITLTGSASKSILESLAKSSPNGNVSVEK